MASVPPFYSDLPSPFPLAQLMFGWVRVPKSMSPLWQGGWRMSRVSWCRGAGITATSGFPGLPPINHTLSRKETRWWALRGASLTPAEPPALLGLLENTSQEQHATVYS